MIVPAHGLDTAGAGNEDAQHRGIVLLVHAEHGERIAMASFGQRGGSALRQGCKARSTAHGTTHWASLWRRVTMRDRPLNGMAVQDGRLAAS